MVQGVADPTPLDVVGVQAVDELLHHELLVGVAHRMVGARQVALHGGLHRGDGRTP
jgi:hypothetical protein